MGESREDKRQAWDITCPHGHDFKADYGEFEECEYGAAPCKRRDACWFFSSCDLPAETIYAGECPFAKFGVEPPQEGSVCKECPHPEDDCDLWDELGFAP